MEKKRGKRIAGFLLAVLAAASVLTVNVPASAADTTATQLKFADSYDADTQLGVSGMSDTQIQVTGKKEVPTAVSSDSSVASVRYYESPPYDTTNFNLYEFDVEAWKPGTATITYSTSDGATLVQKITVVSGVTYPGYKLTSDTTQNFSIQTGNSYFMKVHAIMDDGIGDPVPRLTASDPSMVKITWSDSPTQYDHMARIDAVGKPGQSFDLYLGILGRTSKRLCRVTITSHKGLTLDTNAATLQTSEQTLQDTSAAAYFPAYVLGKQDTYRFTALTSSSVPPAASANNDRVSVKYLRKVAGGYEYQVTALKPGTSLARVTQNGEAASFPLYVPNPAAPDAPKHPAYHTNIRQFLNMVPGETNTFRFTVMGGSEPKFFFGSNGVVNIQSVKKDNINYEVTVTAVGQVGAATGLYMTFPNSPTYKNNNPSQVSIIDLKKVKSDTDTDFSVREYTTYTFKLTGTPDFIPTQMMFLRQN